jgi:hypothetical protein
MGSCDLCKGREIWTIGYLHWPVCPTCGEKDHGPFEPDGVLECHNPKCATFNQIVGRVGREQLEEKLMDLSQGPFIDLDTQNLEDQSCVRNGPTSKPAWVRPVCLPMAPASSYTLARSNRSMMPRCLRRSA